jgi:energy-coupling factor transporter ATP-binding protein EcfA2
MLLRTLKLERENAAGTRILDGFVFGAQNLIVGLNASGKSTVIRSIQTLGKLVSGEQRPQNLASKRVSWLVEFSEVDENFTYELEIRDSEIARERVSRSGKILLDRREDGTGQILMVETQNGKEGELQAFHTPQSDLAIVNRQDSLNHPYLIPLRKWGEEMYAFRGEAELGLSTVMVADSTPAQLKSMKVRSNTPIVQLLQKGLLSEHAERYKKSIVDDMTALGFPITDIGLKILPEMAKALASTGTPIGLFVKEPDLSGVTEQYTLSDGMFRALVLICHLNSFEFAIRPASIVVDDIGLGLDYDRACAVIKLLMKKCRESDIQLIMTSNDRFVMNTVPLESWTVLHRTGARVEAYNYFNSRDVFEEFKDTGLNNFDFFRMDFVNSNAKIGS